MHPLLEVALTGAAAVRLHPLRSAVCVAVLVIALTPYLIGLALARGLEDEARIAAQAGADLYVHGSRFGRPMPVPLAAVDAVRALDGVTAVTPRIVAALHLGRDHVPAVLVGLPAGRLPNGAGALEGDLPRPGGAHEIVIGSALARRLNLGVGAVLPPLQRNDKGERVVRVVGVFRPEAPPWQAHLILTTFDAAAQIYGQPGLATDLLVECRPGYAEAVHDHILQKIAFGPPADPGSVRPHVVTRDDVLALLPQGPLRREGAFTAHLLLGLVAALLVLLVTSGLGLSERRREVGILKACGWHTDEVLLRGAVEGLCLCLVGAALSLLLAWFWLRVLNGYGVAALYLDGAALAPEFRVPYRLLPVPVLLAFVLTLVVVLTGTLGSVWRAAAAAPREAMR